MFMAALVLLKLLFSHLSHHGRFVRMPQPRVYRVRAGLCGRGRGARRRQLLAERVIGGRGGGAGRGRVVEFAGGGQRLGEALLQQLGTTSGFARW